MTNQNPTDEQVAAWIPTQNRGCPPWASLGGTARAWWRDRYSSHQIRNARLAGGRGANSA